MHISSHTVISYFHSKENFWRSPRELFHIASSSSLLFWILLNILQTHTYRYLLEEKCMRKTPFQVFGEVTLYWRVSKSLLENVTIQWQGMVANYCLGERIKYKSCDRKQYMAIEKYIWLRQNFSYLNILISAPWYSVTFISLSIIDLAYFAMVLALI